MTVFFLWLSLKLDVCWLYLVLNSFSVIPICVLFFRGVLFDCCLVYHSLLEALAFERARFFIPAVASFSLFFFYLRRFKNFVVVTRDNLFHILHAAIA